MPSLLFHDALVLDCTGRDPYRGFVLVEDGRIARASRGDARGTADRTIDCGGMTLMPGLTDAHVHFGLISEGPGAEPVSHVSYVLAVLENMRIALDEGFTTVRDAGGLDPAFALAVASGEAVGPRILPSGSFLSITGGHGDQRPRFDDAAQPAIAGLLANTEICDGVDAVRRAARVQLRHGATQVKLMASGGIMSPSDPLESLQFSVEEMAAAVEEARAFGRYAMAHCWTAGAIRNALDAGVRSIEHGALLDEAAAQQIAEQRAFLVPTIVILDILARSSRVPEYSRQKLEMVRGSSRTSVTLASESGVQIGSGSDLLGPRQRRRASEIAEKAGVIGAMDAIVSATRTNADLFCISDRIGTVEDGKDADLILVDGNPLDDPALLSDASRIRMVVQAGSVVKDAR